MASLAEWMLEMFREVEVDTPPTATHTYRRSTPTPSPREASG